MEKSLGQVAYEKWCELVIHPPTWPWHALPESATAGWEEIAQAVIDENMRQKAIAAEDSNG